MSLVVKCDYCQKEVTDYYKMYSYEDNVMVSTSPVYACYDCTHAYRIGQIREEQHDK